MLCKARALPVLWIPLMLAACGTATTPDDEGLPSTAQVRGALEGSWSGTITDAAETVELSLAYLPPAKSPQCGTRGVSHPLCVTITESRVKATLASTDARLQGLTGDGTFQIRGRWNEQTGTYGDLNVSLATSWRLEADIRNEQMSGTIRDVSDGSPPESAIITQFELTRKK